MIPDKDWNIHQQESEGPLPGPEKSDIRFDHHIEYAMILHMTMRSCDNRATLDQVLNEYVPIWKD